MSKKLCLMMATILASATPAHAAYTLYVGDAMDFVENSATSDYLAAQGTPTEFVSFNTLADGTPAIENGLVDGGIFSYGVTFGSLGDPLVNYTGMGDGSEIGPNDEGFFSGTLVITLASPAQAAGFGVVGMTFASFFDQNGALIQSYETPDSFDFVGLIGDGNSQIKTISLTGGFFGIQDFQYTSAAVLASTSDVPEPASWMMMIGGFGALGFAMRRRPATTRLSFS